MAIVYITKNLVNGKKYIGSHKKNNPKYLGSGILLKKAIKKYGKESFKRNTLWEGPEEDMYEVESLICETLNVQFDKMYYNKTNNGYGMPIGFKYTEDQISKMSINHKKPYFQYDLNGNFIKEWKGTEDIKTFLNINPSDISSCCKENQKTAGGFIWMYSYTDKIVVESFKHKGFNKPVIQYNLNGEFIKEYKSAKEAERSIININHKNNISSCCNGKQKTAYGFIWEFK
jgi:hypothetical protein